MPSRPHQRLCTRPGPRVRGSAGTAASGNAELARVPVGSMHKAVLGTPGSLLPRLVPELENRNRAAGSDGLAVEETQALLAPLFSPLWAGGEMSVFIQGREPYARGSERALFADSSWFCGLWPKYVAAFCPHFCLLFLTRVVPLLCAEPTSAQV